MKIKRIDNSCVEDVAWLLDQRNNTIHEYSYWKYKRDDNQYKGVVAYLDGEPVGCFGCIIRQLQLIDGLILNAGWFADWFVKQHARGIGIGSYMLREHRQHCEVVIGHPGTTSAQTICFKNGYTNIPFQSRRMLILQRWHYESGRTRIALKAALRMIAGLSLSTVHRLWMRKQVNNKVKNIYNNSHYIRSDEYSSWIDAQPIKNTFVRNIGFWHGSSVSIKYIDDHLPFGIRRRVLLTEGIEKNSITAWRSFIADAVQANCSYIELFTTERHLDRIWAKLGALSYPDAPLVVSSTHYLDILLHGEDRENWTYLA